MDITQFELLWQLALAALLGALLGIEREIAQKAAGMRTFALVALGSAMFSIISIHGYSAFGFVSASFDPMRIAAQIVTGVGFIGAGMIIFTKEKKLSGITTAAGLWLAAAIGMGVAFGFYVISVFITFLALFIFTFLWHFEERVLKKYASLSEGDND